ncbi:MAG: hypothetical protein GQ569_05835 [Methylococcaceae bacterium]|nr:hypothetical protein [Methylococcaceae bacterium]
MINSDFEQKASLEQQQLITQAVNAGIEKYIISRKAKIPAFVDKNFSFKAAVKLHKKAIGKDLYKAPLNIIWSVPMLGVKSLSFLFNKVGANKASETLNHIPQGFETAVQQEINWLIYTELLEIPYQQEQRASTKDALLEEILNDAALSSLIAAYLQEINHKSTNTDFRLTLEENLKEYAISRTAASDLAGSIISLASNYAAFNKAAPGALSSGKIAAAIIAEKIAISNFWLGSTLGTWYYALFPASASTGLLVVTTSSIIAGLALITTFTGILTDPLQAKLGLHQKRLNRFVDVLHDELLEEKDSQYRIKDQYIVRVFDIVDLLITAVRS